ncbi:GNAT family N-acetyltransferase [Microbacterium sp. cx-55]|uniref:GNAT family N-acetyltransferase n=1 Tax=unclassified Microbacterium TaxID=2609290 RepID=UPI001CBE5039|nr:MULTISPECIES: GNAT family N-acetyltransferase [unclassified Microbacterium]MBZ4486114.1 GNAT family N-acetyltransferase [Microbacterium sp. cx-55]MCC4907105.1 GNAT family N-acetyltransferase [Microbacterium sp. cx-59]UGB34015.1 GNAT family N-acetyltransferase [Microbacterium sp. cx-55]
MSPLSTLEIRPVHAPESVDADGAEDFLRTVEVRNRVYREISGHDDSAALPGELLPFYHESASERRYLWLVLDDGRPVGRVGLNVPLEPGSRTAYALIELLREAWGRGIGTAAHARVEQVARDEGRTILQTWVEHTAAEGEHLAPPTGYGSVPRDHAARFLLRHGYTLEQVVRMSVYDLFGSRDALESHAERARAAASDYRVVQWELPTPEEYVDGFAWMKSRMSTDAPSAGLESDEEAWDAARLREHDAHYLDGGQRMLVTAAQHIETGELCAFNELVIGADPTRATNQEDTLVLSTHRGHRLGLLVKAEGLLAWRDIAPESPRVITYNAEENRPMLDINEALGFVPRTYEGAWKKVLE